MFIKFPYISMVNAERINGEQLFQIIIMAVVGLQFVNQNEMQQ